MQAAPIGRKFLIHHVTSCKYNTTVCRGDQKIYLLRVLYCCLLDYIATNVLPYRLIELFITCGCRGEKVFIKIYFFVRGILTVTVVQRSLSDIRRTFGLIRCNLYYSLFKKEKKRKSKSLFL